MSEATEWREVSPTLHTCIYPPRDAAEARGGDCLGIFIQKTSEGWRAWRSDDAWSRTHPLLADAKHQAGIEVDRARLALLETMARAYGLDPLDWDFDMASVGKGPSFVSKRAEGLVIENHGRWYLLTDDGKPVDQFPTARTAAKHAASLVMDRTEESKIDAGLGM